MTFPSLRALIRHPNLPIALLIFFNTIVGLFTFQSYGMSWDEPLFYAYADAIPSAYSLTARLDGTFVLEEAYGPSSDHGRYGPAYLLLARWPVLALQHLGIDRAAAWHLVNFVTYQAGMLVFYLLLRRWVSALAAWSATALLTFQPVLWGHAFMNPKDIPFMVFFIFSVYAGLRLAASAQAPASLPDLPARQWQRWLYGARLLMGISALSALILTIFPNQIEQAAQNLLSLAYSDPASLPGNIFSLLTVNARNAPLAVYQVKLTRLVSQSVWLAVLAALVFGGMAAVLQFARPALTRMRRWLYLDVPIRALFIAAALVGLTTAVRILGPLAGAIVGLAMLLRWRQRAIFPLVWYGLIAFLVCYIAWPYLWGGPVDQFLAVLARNANNPERVRMLFDGQITYSDELPPTYLPRMLAWTLTEPTWPLAVLGLAAAAWGLRKRRLDWRTYLPVLLWFAAPLAYVLISRPPIYDGFRHFTFIIPGIFILVAAGVDWLLAQLKKPALRFSLIALSLLPAFAGYAQLQPYEYAYYNAFAGGTPGVFRRYETEYWLTCYKEAFDYINAATSGPVFVQRNLRLAQYYARPGREVAFIPDDAPLPSGSIVLQTTRTNGDQTTLPDLPVIYQVERQGAVFCVVKKTP